MKSKLEKQNDINNSLHLKGINAQIEQMNRMKDIFSHKGIDAQIEQMNRMKDIFSHKGIDARIEQMNRMKDIFSHKGIDAQIKQMNRLKDIFSPKGISAQIEQMNKLKDIFSHKGLSAQIGQIVSIQERTIAELNNESYTINNDGTITTPSSPTLNIIDIQSKVYECITKTDFIAKEMKLEKKIAQISKSISNQHPVIVFIVLYIIIPFMVNIYSNGFTSSPTIKYNNIAIIHNKTVIINSMINQFKTLAIEDEALKKYRIVSTECLFVRVGKSIKARVVGRIYFGQIVEIMYKNKNWTLVSWKDEYGEIQSGWVFTRYLKRIE